MRRAVVLAAALLAAASPPAAEALDPGHGVLQFPARTFGSADGLPHMKVTSIVPSRSGHLWVGTQSGLARFDGAQFDLYDTRRSAILPSDLIAFHGLAEDAAGDLWVATLRGDLLRLPAGRHEFTMVRATDGQVATGLWSAGGAIWLATSQALVMVRDGRSRLVGVSDGLPEGRVRGVVADGDGRVWVASQRGLRRLDGERLVAPPETVRSAVGELPLGLLRPAMDGGLWLSAGEQLVHLGPDLRVVQRVGRAEGLPEVRPDDLLEDHDGNVWLAFPEGLARLSGGRISGPFPGGHGFDATEANALAEDGEGNVWVGAQGLVRLRAGVVTTYGRSEGLPFDAVNTVLEGAGGDVWITGVSGLARVRAGKATLVAGTGGGARSAGPMAMDRAGTLWVGVGRDLARLRGGQLEVVAPALSIVNALGFDAEDTLWVGTVERLGILRRGRIEPAVGEGHPLATDRINAVHLGPDGTLWVVGERAGVFRRVEGLFVPALPAGLPFGAPYTAVLADPDGTFWVGTSASGLWRIRGEAFTIFGVRQGLVELAAFAVLDDGRGHLWLPGDQGVRRVARAELEAVAAGRLSAVTPVVYGLAEGMRGLESTGGYGGTALVARSGSIWVATPTGAIDIDTRRARLDPPPPPAVLSWVSADGSALQRSGREQALGPGLHRVDVQFGGVSLTSPERLRFRYQLEGFDPDWQEVGQDRRAQYTNLPPGRYRFIVQASLGGPWGAPSPPLDLWVRPFLWQRPWFLPSLAALLTLALAGLVGWRVRALEARARALKVAADAAAAEVRTLRGLLPVCAWCHKVREDAGSWKQLEQYVSEHTHATFSHGMCPQCFAKNFPDEEPDDSAPP